MTQTLPLKHIDPHRIDQPVSGLPDDFRYSEGYFEPRNRQQAPEALKVFHELLHPYLVANGRGETTIDGDAPRAAYIIRNKFSGEDNGALKSAMRFLELGGEPDAPMQATYEQEDQLEWAQTLSEAGHHGNALGILEHLARPFQQTATAARVYRKAYYTLGRYHDALAHADGKCYLEEKNPYRIAQDRLARAELLLLTGQIAEAEAILNEWRKSLFEHYTYFGIRAGIALAKGDRATARLFVQRAACRDCYHCYKLLWLHSLRPIADWLANELLTEDGGPLPWAEDGELRLLANHIQCLAIRGHHEEARALADAIVPGKAYQQDTSNAVQLAWFAIGEFARARRWASAFRLYKSCRVHAIVEQTCDLFLDEDDPSRPDFSHAPDTPDLDERTGDALRALARARASNEAPAFAYEQIVAEVWEGSTRRARHVWFVTWRADSTLERTLWEGPERTLPEQRHGDFDPRLHFSAVETEVLESREALADWLENEITENDDFTPGMYRYPKRSLRFATGALLRLFPEIDSDTYPRLARYQKACSHMANAQPEDIPHGVRGRSVPFTERVYENVFAGAIRE